MSDPLVYRLGGRGTGKTTRLVKATPTGGTYVVSTGPMTRIISNYLKEIGRDGDLTVVSVDNITQATIGRRAPIAIDHSCFELGLDDEIRAAIFTQPLVLTNDYQGDVITSYQSNRS